MKRTLTIFALLIALLAPLALSTTAARADKGGKKGKREPAPTPTPKPGPRDDGDGD